MPVQPSLAAQVVALVEVQVSVTTPPLFTEAALAVKVAVGSGAATVTDVEAGALVPPAPAQTKV